MSFKKQVLFLSVVVLFVLGVVNIFLFTSEEKIGADVMVPTMIVSPSKTSVALNEQFTIQIIANSAGQNYTSFKADVDLTNLSVVSLQLDPSVDQWVDSPSTSSLNFLAGVFGNTSVPTTIFTATLQPVASGSATITLNNTAIYQTDGFTVTNILADEVEATINIEAAPGVNAGSDRRGYVSVPYLFTGSVSGAFSSLLWEKNSGPGEIYVENSATMSPYIVAMMPGNYVIKLTAQNAGGLDFDTTNFVVHNTADINGDADVNPDDYVNDLDFTILLYNITTFSNPMADLNNDGSVTLDEDLTLLMANLIY